MNRHTIVFFEYKGAIAAQIDMEEGSFINDPKAKNQMGCVVKASDIGLPKEVKEAILKDYHREGGSFASMMLTKHDSGNCSIGLLGFGKVLIRAVRGMDIEISRNCDLSVLDACVEIPNDPPQDFINYVDKMG